MSEFRNQIIRLYDATFDRAPDPGGLAFWHGHLDTGALALPQVANLFFTAPEFASLYGQPDHAAFVGTLYRNVLDREGEWGGHSFWTGLLDRGEAARNDVTLAFSESAEHIARMEIQYAPPASAPAPDPAP